MQWIEALINISALAGFIGVANAWPENHQNHDEVPTSAATSLGILIEALVGKTTSTVLTVLLRSLKTSRGPVFFGAASIGANGPPTVAALRSTGPYRQDQI
jgi:hypothetical protein